MNAALEVFAKRPSGGGNPGHAESEAVMSSQRTSPANGMSRRSNSQTDCERRGAIERAPMAAASMLAGYHDAAARSVYLRVKCANRSKMSRASRLAYISELSASALIKWPVAQGGIGGVVRRPVVTLTPSETAALRFLHGGILIGIRR
jgi:hypothetical protein